MEQEALYKDQYDRTLDRKNEINGSLSTPIGILTALVAGLLYATSNFQYNDLKGLMIIFVIISLASIYLLGRSIYHLVKALSDAHQGYNYAYLPDAKDLDNYYQGLITFYQSQPGTTNNQAIDSAKKDFDAYLLGLLIDGADINQKNNKSKMFQRFKCHQYMIFAFISLSLLIIPYGIDFALNKDKEKVQKVKVEGMPSSLILKCKDTTEHSTIKKTGNGKTTKCGKTGSAPNPNDPGRR